MVTGSIFDSKYKDIDGVERNTRFNRNYVFNVVSGKEWTVQNKNLLSLNMRLNYLGGKRIEPVDLESSLQQKEVIYGETNGELAFANKHDDIPIVSLSISYRKNKARYSSIWSLQLLNVLGNKEYSRDIYNIKDNSIEKKYNNLMIPNLSYRIEF